MDSAKRIDIDDPAVDEDGSGNLLFEGAPFTGEVAEYSGESLVSLDEYVDGVLHGRSREWYADGTLRSEGQASMGRPVGTSKEWHPNGSMAEEKRFSQDGLRFISRESWDNHGNPRRE
ncbi:toxin-antitoxin system YwqK family antitoxin [Streptomyces cyaneofuscatus]|uniref:toxin-antitoxin system YwqK family antitoxin n=1 Tax=Streptomyces cyaneofuscatus TaxID=66883 RepID=UPI0036DAEB42